MTMLVIVFCCFVLHLRLAACCCSRYKERADAPSTALHGNEQHNKEKNEFYFEFYFETEGQEVCQNHGETDLSKGCLLKLGWRI